ncbi:MAG: hypothetical protein H7122_16385 [Chitinophagaceae bacterium]|nr:hypothetical protein [Chitinophagaceae bacterium]
MKPKNSPERKKAFIRFVIFYLISTALIITAIFFGLQVPFKENKQLQSQLDVVYKERDFDRKLFNLMSETRKMLDTVNSAGTKTEVVEGRINQNILQMDAMLNKDSIAGKKIYSELVLIFNDAKNDKKLIRAASDKDATVKIKDQEIKELKQNLEGWRAAYDKQQIQLMQLQNKQ